MLDLEANAVKSRRTSLVLLMEMCPNDWACLQVSLKHTVLSRKRQMSLVIKIK